MSRFKIVISIFLVLILFASCAPSAPVTSNIPAASAPSSSKTAAPQQSPSAAVSESPAESGGDIDLGTAPIKPDSEGYEIIPGTLAPLTEADKTAFNSDKVYSYLAEDGALTSSDYSYDINKAQLKDGSLDLFLTVEIALADVNDAYQDLKSKHSLADGQILSIPAFSGCVIHDGVMYTNADAYQARQGYDTYSDWQKDYNGFANSSGGVVKYAVNDPVPVSAGADIILYNFDGSGTYTRVPMQQFSFFLLNSDNKTQAQDGSVYSLSFVYFKYSNGEISAVYQDSGDQ